MGNLKFINAQLEQGTLRWEKFREGKVSSTTAPAFLLPKDKYGISFNDHIMMQLGLKDKPDFSNMDFIFELGHKTEKAARIELQNAGYDFEPIVAVSKMNDQFIASLDGYDFSKDVIMEHKLVGQEAFDRAQKTGQVEAHFEYQVHWQLFITNAKMAIIVLTNKVDEKRCCVELYPNDSLMKIMDDKANEYLSIIDGEKDLPGAVVEQQKIYANETLSADIDSLLKLLTQEKALKEEITQLKARVETELNGSEFEDSRIKISQTTRKGTLSASSLIKHFKLDKDAAESLRGRPSTFLKYTPNSAKKAKGAA